MPRLSKEQESILQLLTSVKRVPTHRGQQPIYGRINLVVVVKECLALLGGGQINLLDNFAAPLKQELKLRNRNESNRERKERGAKKRNRFQD